MANPVSDTAQIKQQFEKIMHGAMSRDIDTIMSVYWNDDRLVEYDIPPPTQFVGWAAVKANYQSQLGTYQNNVEGRWDEPTIHTSGDLGHVFTVNRWSFDDVNGQRIVINARISQLFKRIDGEWLVVHEHVSVPVADS